MLIRLVILLVAVGVVWAPAQSDESASESRTVDPGPVSDNALKKEIQKRFAASAIARNQFQVDVRNGTAILRGRTDVIQHKGTATRLAKLAGATQVDNRIEVTDRARSSASRSSRSQPRRVYVRRPRSERREER